MRCSLYIKSRRTRMVCWKSEINGWTMYRSDWVLALCVLFAHTAVRGKNQTPEELSEKCAAETGYNLNDDASHFDSDGKPNHIALCFITCRGVASRILMSDGKQRTNDLIKSIKKHFPDKEKFIEDMLSCGEAALDLSSGRKDKCEKGYAVLRCWKQKKLVERYQKGQQKESTQES